MANISFDEIVKLAEQLPENQQNELIYHLRIKQMEQKIQHVVGDDLSAHALHAELYRIATEWELELDDFDSHKD